MAFIRRHTFVTILLTVLITVLVTVVVLNFATSEKKIQHRIDSLYGIDEPQFRRSMGSLLGPPLVDGNSVTPLVNGVQIFPAMLDAIRNAQRTITFETFIYWSGEIGREFANALSERAQNGVKVHVLIDWVGSTKMDDALLKQMEQAGVEVQRYHPPRWYTLSRMNNRTHRKLLVVDGVVGFTGGVGVADQWQGNAENKDQWRDSHYRLAGPAVAQMQSAFMDNWMKATGHVLHGEGYFPPLDSAAGGAVAQLFRSSPGEGSESVRLMYLLSIASAKKTIRIAAAYFIPDDLSIATIVTARKRGVRVQVILPADPDSETTRRASRARWGKLLEAGVEIYEYVPTMYHCKIMVVDSLWTSVGSTNFDNRSFRLNDEANLNVYDAAFAATQIADFETDLTRSRRVTLEMWQNRPWHEKVVEHIAALFRSQL